MALKYKIVFVVVFYFGLMSGSNANELDNVAACSGVVLGNAAVDFSLGDEDSFKEGVELSITAYLSEILAGSSSKDDVAISDQILQTNSDKIINVANTNTFDANIYEEVVQCYRKVASILLKNMKTIEKNRTKIDALVDKRVNLIKRILSAG